MSIYANGNCSGTALSTVGLGNKTSFAQSVTVATGSTTTFSATAHNANGTSTCSNSITYTAGITTTFTWSDPSAITYPTSLSATQLDATISPAAAASNGTIAYTPSLGTVLTAGNGQQLKVTFTPNPGSAYLASSATVSLNVNQAQQAITFNNPGNHVYGDTPFTLSATGGGSGNPVVFSLAPGSAGCALSGTNNSTVTITAATASGSSCVIDANQAGTPNYLAATQVQQSFTVAKATPQLMWANPATITYPSTLGSALDAQALVPGTFSYTLNGAPVNSSTVPDAGMDQPLSVTFTPSDTNDYTTATANQSITVHQASQTLTVDPLAAHTYGDPPFSVTASSSNPSLPLSYSASGACTNTGPSITITSAGTCSVIVTQPGNNNYSDATSVTVTSTISQNDPTVNWATVAPITYGTALSGTQLGATLNYSIDPTAVAPTPGTWTYTLPDSTVLTDGSTLPAGSWSVTASWTPDPGPSTTNYAPAQTTVTITVDKATPSLSWSDQTVTYPTTLGTTVLNAGVAPYTVGTGLVEPTGKISYTLDGVTTTASGATPGADSHTLTATFAPDTATAANFTSATITVNLTVNQGSQTITYITEPSNNVYGDGPFDVTAAGGWSTSPVTFASQTPAVCSVTSSFPSAGAFTAVVAIDGAGDCQIAADQAGDANYNPALEVVQDESVAKADPTIVWPTPASIVFGTALDITQLNASVSQGDASGTYTYTLADGTTPASGALLDAGSHQALNVAFHDTDGNYNDAVATVYIDVDPAPQTITFPSIPDHTYGDSDFGVFATGGRSGNLVTFTATGNCTVSSNGTLVHILGAGSCTITANQDGSSNYLAAEPVSETFNIAKADQTIGSITPSVDTFTYGDTPFTVSATASSGLPVSFSASGACTSSGDTITIIAAGDCFVTAGQPGDANFNPALDVVQDFVVQKADQTITGFTLPATATFLNQPITVTPSGGGSGEPVVLTTSSLTCSVSGNTVTILHAGMCSVAANQDGNNDYNAAPEVDQTIAIAKYTPVISWSPDGITYGTVLGPQQLDAVLDPNSVAGTFGYTGVDSANNPVDLASTLHAGNYTLTATFTPDDPGDVNVVSKDAAITVNKADQTITFDAIGGTHTYGDPAFDVSASASSGLPVSFAASDDTSSDCAVGSNGDSMGTVTIDKAGACTVVASQGGNGDYVAAPDVSQTFTASQATPEVDWTQPASITYGTALGSGQLDATASFNGSPVSGTFSYSPTTGAVLHAGDQLLSVTFTPDDATDFTTAARQVTLHVNQAGQSITLGAIPDHTYGDPNFGVLATGGDSGNPVTFTAAGDCTVTPDGSVVHITAAGSCSVTASQAGNADYTAATDVTRTFNVAKEAQIIGTITPSVGTFTYGDPAFSVSATGGASGNPVTFSASGACTSGGVNGATIAITSAGSCWVAANQAGTSNFLDAVQVTRTFTVAQADQSISFAPITFGTTGAALGSTATLSATASSGLPVIFTTAGPCGVSGTTLTLYATPGTCTVTAHQQGNTNFKAAPDLSQSLLTFYFGGFLPPVANGAKPTKGGATGTTPPSFKQGSTIPFKFQFVNAYGTSVQLSSPPMFTTSSAATNSNPSTAGVTAQWDPTGQQYQYNLGTKNMAAGTYTVTASVGPGGPTWSTQIILTSK